MENNHFSTLPLHSDSTITVIGAREHNLKNINLSLPKGDLIVFTGPSGSGKSSLAFDTLYAEGQRRYVESLSAYARQFLDQMSKPNVDRIDGLSPAISIDQKTTGNNPRSTVGTVTEIYDYLRLLFARVGTAYSPTTGLPISPQTRPQMIQRIEKMPENTRYMLLAPIARSEKGEFRKELEDLRKRGYQRVQIDGIIHELDGVLPVLTKNKRHTIHVVIDRLVQNDQEETRARLMASLETALTLGRGVVVVSPVQSQDDENQIEPFTLSSQFSCPESGFTLEEIEPRLFSFNNPFGACPACSGLGIPEWGVAHYSDDLMDVAKLPICEACQGYRLKPEALCIKISGHHIGQVCQQAIEDIFKWCQNVPLDLNTQHLAIADRILREINSRLCFLLEVGLGYLSLSRGSGTLSGGESQRIRLASQVGSGLTGVLYVLDEPSIGLHQRDNAQLLKTLTKLKTLGNTVIVVEHDEDAIRLADYVVDFGPGAGRFGGEICAQGPLQSILASPNSLTGDFLSGRKRIDVPENRRTSDRKLRIVNAWANNLKHINVDFPLGTFIAVTGVSGSGKSSLIMDTLREGLADHCNKSSFSVACDRIEGTEHIDKLVSIDQSPIGRTPRSNPATYTGVFTPIREWFAFLPESKALGYGPGRFSFNVKGGRCEACEGDGVLTIAMHFLPDIQVPCEACKGKRYGYDTLGITYKGKSIADVLAMSCEEAAVFFSAIPSIAQRLNTLVAVGLGYMQIGQSAPTLSGGEAQRVKLAKELSRRSTGKTVYILDEPTTGLHFNDVKVLLGVLHRLVNQGNTVIVIEHNLEVVKTADWVIDIGPEGGSGGGVVVSAGTPEHVAQTAGSYTGQYLAPLLQNTAVPLESRGCVL
ncbi:MAG: excinuclease ABC subunit A [Alphaproteobacteria bacterium]|nr:excinuclease ABC subunit A [Alphaproteobacteria bacterium]